MTLKTLLYLKENARRHAMQLQSKPGAWNILLYRSLNPQNMENENHEQKEGIWEISWEELFWGNGIFQVMWDQEESLNLRSSEKPTMVKIRGKISCQRMRAKPDIFWRGILLESGGGAFGAAEVHFCLLHQLPWSVNTIVQDSVKSTAWFLSGLLWAWMKASSLWEYPQGETSTWRFWQQSSECQIYLPTYPSMTTEMPMSASLLERHIALTPNITLKMSINIFCPKSSSTASALWPWGCWNLLPKPGKAPGCNMENEMCIPKNFSGSHSACDTQRALATFTLQDEKMHFTCKQILV